MSWILALDLGTTTGWAKRTHVTVWYGTATFQIGKFDGGGMRFLKFRGWLDMQIVTHAGPPTAVLYEKPMSHKGVDAAHVYGGFLAGLTAWCEEHRVPYHGIAVPRVKKFWTGKGNANKQAMIDEAERRGFLVANDNEADALAVLHCGVQECLLNPAASASDAGEVSSS